jgi:hypothetical protein
MFALPGIVRLHRKKNPCHLAEQLTLLLKLKLQLHKPKTLA